MKSDCQHLFGQLGVEPDAGDFGRFFGSGISSPCRVRYRLTVAGDTLTWWWCSRCKAMVCGPAFRPCPDSSSGSLMISSSVVSLIAAGEVFGRRHRGSNAASPSAPWQGQQRADPRPGDPVGVGLLNDRRLFDSDRSDDKPGFRHQSECSDRRCLNSAAGRDRPRSRSFDPSGSWAVVVRARRSPGSGICGPHVWRWIRTACARSSCWHRVRSRQRGVLLRSLSAPWPGRLPPPGTS
jgi:hypothetical protein